jgi:hypothetical protein
MAGTPPNKMRYTLHAEGSGMKLRLYYPNAGAYNVYANGSLKAYTPWDSDIGGPAALTKNKGCGENRFVGVVNFLEFYLTPGCEIRVEPLDQIFTNVRLSWTLAEFYSSGGTTTFADRVAGALGIPAWRIKTVAVYEGSVVIEYVVLKDDSLEDSDDELVNVGAKMSSFFSDPNSTWLGAPVLSVTSGGVTVVDQELILDTTTSTATLIDEFLAS